MNVTAQTLLRQVCIVDDISRALNRLAIPPLDGRSTEGHRDIRALPNNHYTIPRTISTVLFNARMMNGRERNQDCQCFTYCWCCCHLPCNADLAVSTVRRAFDGITFHIKVKSHICMQLERQLRASSEIYTSKSVATHHIQQERIER
jgi:hypothetical protein